jgi:3D (Asp-Asp-Asp) domain-containing protein
MEWAGVYFTDSGWALTSTPDTYLIRFDGLNVPGNSISGNTLAVDVRVVPIPAAVWLFGSGLLGMVGVARRRS